MNQQREKPNQTKSI